MIPYGRQSIDKKDIVAVSAVLKSDWLTQGPKVLEFEKALAKYCSAKFAVAVSSGTAALHLAYSVAGIGEGDEVITTPNTFVATTNMLLVVGAKPVFCDIRLDIYNLDKNEIEKLITKKTKAIVPVHFAGQPCEMDVILKIAKKYGLLVIEDACHALGAKCKNKKIGSISDMTIFSFHPVKSVTTGEGGAVLTNNKNFYKKLILLRSHGVVKDKKGFNVMTALGYNYRLTDIQAALGISQLKKLDKFIQKRHQAVELYEKYLVSNKNIILPKELTENCSAWHLYVIRTKSEKTRLPLYNFLKKNGVGVNFHYPPVYSQPYYRKNGYENISLPNAELYNETAITIPLFADISEKEIKYVSGKINKFFNG
ncbi:MAG: UDP-4-amino-4,6-dideoxy-N-acetyl-beta-L-altrosamine transaminase [Candidatus Taylorbacteria bacterium RIFCSPHIGHO2_02_FULL_44_36]|uniref:UDP-4-amino-4, 6-dideoxy-N-acetyl-beta-L-altrosamine transaminase n=1 Tax=Candidatus Taylorbacteria bacterium RIFCSPLOWO2_12_FULL_44_15c TaxID=1802333 RepID=A0A1G2P4A8_9BACT|nr:MAG: UDP-4-amino-4,6-dideoxy-N-acetyl-beta-L-altrosamine transaminase [Candidatus Taylorbacteria bacterium RIFCSPHIGHO2_02_FULL_44_36]OHA43170.1 MAG: UDP-4-amino-4,6-dideoxy-N-acetyl-beta-L-altrosamine transaminase [Candidatus Taylorbacteria bacterium RIFCSPLOWO2_12_FULL_44_15c]